MALYRIRAILWKELLQLARDRITFAMVIMIPLVQLLLFGYAIETNLRNIPAALVDHSRSELSQALTQMVEATQVVRFTESFTHVAEAERAMAAGTVRAVFVIPEDLAKRVVRSPATGFATPRATDVETSRPIAQWIADGSDLAVGGAIKSLRGMPMAELFRKPANASVPTFEVALFYNPEQRSAVNIVPGLVAIILTMTMILFTALAIVRETERGNIEMLITTPLRSIELMVGKILPYVAIGLIQAGLILGAGHLIFDVPIVGNLWVFLLGTMAFISASLSLGLMISTVANNQLQAMQMTVFLLLPSILLSGFMFPYEGMPKVAQHLADLLPATHYIGVVRGVVLRDAGLAEVAPGIIWLAVFTCIGMGVASVRFRKKLD